MDPIYFDHNATTPIHPDVFEAMAPYLARHYGNPSCVYSLGVECSYAIEKARLQLAGLIHAEEDEMVFTGCGTESDNLAVKGAVYASGKKHVITSIIEHPAIRKTCEFLEKYWGGSITYLPVDREGFVDPAEVEQAITPATAVVSIMLANNEVGSLEPIREIAEITQRRGVLFHTDAIQAVGRIPVDVRELGVDLLSISGHKLNGPKGVGALFIRKGVELVPIMNGGGQESGRRGGTENVSGIVGLGKAAALAKKEMSERMEKSARLRDRLWEKLQALPWGITRNSPQDAVLPGTLNVTIPDINGRELVRLIADENVCISSGSACASGKTTPSHVILALGRTKEEAIASIRLSLGSGNTDDEVDRFVEILEQVHERARLSAASAPKGALSS